MSSALRRLGFRAAPLLRRSFVRRNGASSVDDALRAALSRVTEQVRNADPSAVALSSPGEDAAGASAESAVGNFPGVRTAGPKMLLRFTCTHEACDEKPTITRVISKRSYEQGVVLVRCPSCLRQHLIADRLGWFGEKADIEQIMAEKGEAVQRMDPDLVHVG